MSSMGKIFRHIDTGEAGPIMLKCKLARASSLQLCVCPCVKVIECLCERDSLVACVYEDGHFSEARWRPLGPSGAIWEPDGIPI